MRDASKLEVSNTPKIETFNTSVWGLYETWKFRTIFVRNLEVSNGHNFLGVLLSMTAILPIPL